MPYVTGYKRETMLERRDRKIREGEEKMEEFKGKVKKLNAKENVNEQVLALKKDVLPPVPLMTSSDFALK